jgi:hypothetical protein
MKKLLSILLSVVVLTSLPATTFAKKSSGLSSPSKGGSHSVRGHVRKDGTYVQPHRATNQNSTQRDNWSSKPNVNPYTGSPGTKQPKK